MPNLWTAGDQEFREAYFYKTCREQREISVHCFRLQRDLQHEKCTDTAFGEKAWNRTAETVSLPSRWLHLWTIPDEWTPSSAFEKETSAGKSALKFLHVDNIFSTSFQCAHKNRNSEFSFSQLALGRRERFPAIAGIASILSHFLLNLTLKQPCVHDCDDTQSIFGGAISGWWWVVPNLWEMKCRELTWNLGSSSARLSIFWK